LEINVQRAIERELKQPILYLTQRRTAPISKWNRAALMFVRLQEVPRDC